MVKRKTTLSIDYASLGIEEADVQKVVEIAKREAPHLKKGFRKVESEVESAVRTIYDRLAGDDENDEERDILGKLLG
jgi:hypothetical protein